MIKKVINGIKKMNNKIPAAVITASISAVALVAAHQKLNTEEDKVNKESVDDLADTIAQLQSANGNKSILNKELAKSLANEKGELLGININEVLAKSDWSSKYNPYGYFEETHSNAGENPSDCYTNCHSNCHGSRSWR
ncbi:MULTISPECIES: hypothetical protein [Vibrio]|uniref:Uncharacterized protein n=2 Tax=Vibrio TaxID=662 RepID=A0AAN1PW48_VIBVL|nr:MULTISPECIES: hypothetical protein [Vibrio]EJG0764721.1 hypothetical protein [Vibrio parahaemolyticus O5:K30]AXX63793.1 hypothetical protein FORC53_5454 [Vibrio vulnificus]EGR2217697.1 hypothetical protein [Vibrio parahaemolyticus]MBE4202871.1 hypothetical protein [Vibrio parahaemolyticus]MBE4779776.1 hypothetical protein [Vibrio parahaemolyticus]